MLEVSGFHFSMSSKTIQKESEKKKTKSLKYPNTITEFFSEFGYLQDFFYVPRTIRGKKQTPWTIQIVSQKFWQNVVKKQTPGTIRGKKQTP